MRIVSLLLSLSVGAAAVAACVVIDGRAVDVLANDVDDFIARFDAVDDSAARIEIAPIAPLPTPNTLRRHDMTTTSWSPADRELLAAVEQIFVARLDLWTLPRFTPVSVWTLGDAVVAAEVRADDAEPLMAVPADFNGRIAFFDEAGGAFAGAFIPRPVDYLWVSSRFGPRVHPLSGQLRKHQGLDLSAETGTPVVSVADGVVVTRATASIAGNNVAVRHKDGTITRYFHLDAFADGLKVGRQIKRGEAVGVVGATGAVTGPHLHFERWQNGRCLDPATPWPAGKRLPSKLRKAHAQLAGQLRAMTVDDELASWPEPEPPPPSPKKKKSKQPKPTTTT